MACWVTFYTNSEENKPTLLEVLNLSVVVRTVVCQVILNIRNGSVLVWRSVDCEDDYHTIKKPLAEGRGALVVNMVGPDRLELSTCRL